MLDNLPEVRAAHDVGDCCFGTIDSWLVYRLTGGKKHVTSVCNASRYLLMDLKTQSWSEECLTKLGIKEDSLPKIVTNCAKGEGEDNLVFGEISKEFMPEFSGIPIRGVIGDQHAALVGQCCFGVGESKNTYGTGCFLMYYRSVSVLIVVFS